MEILLIIIDYKSVLWNFYISPIMYVNPMGRDVQFFIKPNISSAIAGNEEFITVK